MDNIYKAVQLTIDSQNLALSKKPTHVYIANQYVDTNDTPLITAPFIIQKALENGTGVVDIVSSTIGSIYEVRLLCDAEVLISGYFYMPPMNAKFSELELYTSYPPRTPPVVNEFWQQTEQYILEKTNTLLNFVQVFNGLSSMRLSLGYLEVSIHAPVWGATCLRFLCHQTRQFQSTHPCGVRHSSAAYKNSH